MIKATASSPAQLEQLFAADAEQRQPAIKHLEILLLAPLDAIPVSERNIQSRPVEFSWYRGMEGYLPEELSYIKFDGYASAWRTAFKAVPNTLESLAFNLRHDTFTMRGMQIVRLVQELVTRMQMRSKGACKLHLMGCRQLSAQRTLERTSKSFVPVNEEDFRRQSRELVMNEKQKNWEP